MATLPATIPRTPKEISAKKDALLARAGALGWSQNELARRANKNIGHFSRVLSGERISAKVWSDAEKTLARAERRHNGAESVA